MTGFELTSIGQSLKTLAELLDKLRKKPKERDATIAAFQEAYFSVKEQALALYDENLSLGRDMEKLKTENMQETTRLANIHAAEKANFASQLETLNKGHADQIAQMTAAQSKPTGDELDEVCKEMLITLANKPPHDGVTDNELIQHFGLPKAKGDFLFTQLNKRKFVAGSGGQMGRGTFYFVTELGLKYLADNGLIDAKPKKPISVRPSSGSFRIGRVGF